MLDGCGSSRHHYCSGGSWRQTVVVEAFVLVDVEQDANTSDVTIRMVSAIQMTPLFI